MLPPSIAKPHWSGLPSPLVSFVSFLAVSTNSDHVFGGWRFRVLEELLVVEEAVGQAVERDRGRLLPGRAAGRERRLEELVLAADRLQVVALEGDERARRLQRRRPRVADIEDVGALAARRRGRDVGEQVRPRDDLELHVHAGLLLEATSRVVDDLLVLIDRRALVRRPVLDRRAGLDLAATGAFIAAAARGDGQRERGDHPGGGCANGPA
jgi:hypothetical protein